MKSQLAVLCVVSLSGDSEALFGAEAVRLLLDAATCTQKNKDAFALAERLSHEVEKKTAHHCVVTDQGPQLTCSAHSLSFIVQERLRMQFAGRSNMKPDQKSVTAFRQAIAVAIYGKESGLGTGDMKKLIAHVGNASWFSDLVCSSGGGRKGGREAETRLGVADVMRSLPSASTLFDPVSDKPDAAQQVANFLEKEIEENGPLDFAIRMRKRDWFTFAELYSQKPHHVWHSVQKIFERKQLMYYLPRILHGIDVKRKPDGFCALELEPKSDFSWAEYFDGDIKKENKSKSQGLAAFDEDHYKCQRLFDAVEDYDSNAFRAKLRDCVSGGDGRLSEDERKALVGGRESPKDPFIKGLRREWGDEDEDESGDEDEEEKPEDESGDEDEEEQPEEESARLDYFPLHTTHPAPNGRSILLTRPRLLYEGKPFMTFANVNAVARRPVEVDNPYFGIELALKAEALGIVDQNLSPEDKSLLAETLLRRYGRTIETSSHAMAIVGVLEVEVDEPAGIDVGQEEKRKAEEDVELGDAPNPSVDGDGEARGTQPTEKRTKTKTEKVLIVRNSWGVGWGLGGHFLLHPNFFIHGGSRNKQHGFAWELRKLLVTEEFQGKIKRPSKRYSYAGAGSVAALYKDNKKRAKRLRNILKARGHGHPDPATSFRFLFREKEKTALKRKEAQAKATAAKHKVEQDQARAADKAAVAEQKQTAE